MGLDYQIEYEEKVVAEDIPNLSTKMKERVKKSIVAKLMSRPDIFGKPLRSSAKGYWALRIGDYRLVFRLEGRIVKIFIIEHQSRVYQVLQQRLASEK